MTLHSLPSAREDAGEACGGRRVREGFGACGGRRRAGVRRCTRLTCRANHSISSSTDLNVVYFLMEFCGVVPHICLHLQGKLFASETLQHKWAQQCRF